MENLEAVRLKINSAIELNFSSLLYSRVSITFSPYCLLNETTRVITRNLNCLQTMHALQVSFQQQTTLTGKVENVRSRVEIQ